LHISTIGGGYANYKSWKSMLKSLSWRTLSVQIFVLEMIVHSEGYVDRSLRNTNLHWWNSLVKPYMKLLSCCCCSFDINIMLVTSINVWRLLQFNWYLISPLSSIFVVGALDENYPGFSVVLHVGFVVGRVLLAQVVILAFRLPSVKLFTLLHIHSFFHSISTQ
jgi:hypothetical protein